jgi:hypothetical protein
MTNFEIDCLAGELSPGITKNQFAAHPWVCSLCCFRSYCLSRCRSHDSPSVFCFLHGRGSEIIGPCTCLRHTPSETTSVSVSCDRFA